MQTALDSGRIEILNCMKHTFHDDIRRDILRGLTAKQKSIPSKYFYDARGSRLFEEICSLPEYYQTRTELWILKEYAGEIVRDLRRADIVELGSGSSLKIRTLLAACFRSPRSDIRYVPVDVSEAALKKSTAELLGFYPGLKIAGIVADFTKNIRKMPRGRQRLFLFLGGTIGNFSRQERAFLLKRAATMMTPGDRFLLGIDMIKRTAVLERAYNDSRGITAEFNRNILNVLNHELKADFDPAGFDHVAFYNAGEERIEMHLRANRAVVVEIAGLGMQFSMEKGEMIRTEISAKFSRESAEEMAEAAGLKIDRWFTDPKNWFSLIELTPNDRK